jgi:hypothetical protein
MKCVFLKFSDNRFALNQLSDFWRISLIIMLNSLGFCLVIKTLVSSANSIGVDFYLKIWINHLYIPRKLRVPV